MPSIFLALVPLILDELGLLAPLISPTSRVIPPRSLNKQTKLAFPADLFSPCRLQVGCTEGLIPISVDQADGRGRTHCRFGDAQHPRGALVGQFTLCRVGKTGGKGGGLGGAVGLRCLVQGSDSDAATSMPPPHSSSPQKRPEAGYTRDSKLETGASLAPLSPGGIHANRRHRPTYHCQRLRSRLCVGEERTRTFGLRPCIHIVPAPPSPNSPVLCSGTSNPRLTVNLHFSGRGRPPRHSNLGVLRQLHVISGSPPLDFATQSGISRRQMYSS